MESYSRASTGAHRLRRLNQPVGVEVRCDDRGLPRSIRWDRRYRTVARLTDIWCVEDEWWRPRAVERVYFQVELTDGRSLTLYRDMVEDTWWMQRY